MQISVNVNQITAPAAPVHVAGGGAVVVEDAETNDSVAFAPVDPVSISEAGRRASEQPIQNIVEPTVEPKARPAADGNDASQDVKQSNPAPENDRAQSRDSNKADNQQIVQERNANEEKAEQKQQQADLSVIRQLKARDREVKAHEAAHAAIGGDLAGAPTFTYTQGPDGVRYAVGGEVSISVGKVANDPQATLEKMVRVQRAALAPAEPSSQDRQVAAQAAQLAAEARAEILAEKRDASVSASEASDEARDKAREEVQAAKEKREEDLRDEKQDNDNQAVSAADLFAEENARSRRINQALLEITLTPSTVSGGLINADA